MHSTPTTGTSTPTDAAHADRAAFDRTASARAAMKPEDAPHYGLDAVYAAGKALWIAPRVQPYRDAIRAHLPTFDLSHLDDLADHARALRFVHTEIVRRVERAKQLPELAQQGFELRGLMMAYAETLSYKKTIAPELIVKLREGSGYRDLVEDLTVLVRELQSLPPSYTGPEAPVTRADLNRAAEIADQVNAAVGNAADIDLSQTALLVERRKLGVLLTRSHSQIRRALTYLRWDQGDVNELVPSLYVTGGGRKAAEPGERPDLATLHEELHEHMPTDPEDNPFTSE